MSFHRFEILDTGNLWWSTPVDQPPGPHPVYAYVIRSASGRVILVDTGNPRRLIGQKTANPWFDSKVEMGEEHDLRNQLAALDLSVGDVQLLVSTHFDFDHCGNHDLFDATGITSLVQQSHLDEVQQDSRYDPGLWRRPGIEYQAIVGDYEIEPGLSLLSTSGHTRGHMSLYLESKDGPVILAIDAIDDRFALGDGPYPSFYYSDHDEWLKSRSRLLDLQRETGATLYFGHEREPLTWTGD